MDLTTGEFELLAMLAKSPGRIFSRDELLEATRNREAGPFDRTIDVQIGRLRRKIEIDPQRPALIKSVGGPGMSWPPKWNGHDASQSGCAGIVSPPKPNAVRERARRGPGHRFGTIIAGIHRLSAYYGYTAVSSMTGMLARTLGEHIRIVETLTPDLPNVFVDAGQLETALLNLAVNARDAMPQGGRLSIETSEMIVDDSDADSTVSLAPGSYVMVAVSDTGSGMPPEVAARGF